MRTFKRILGFVLVFILVLGIFTFLLTPPSGIRVLLKQAKEGDYNVLIMGQSHAECGYNPYIISDGLDCKAVSVARRITPMNNINYIMQEANVDGKYKTVILDIDPYYWRLDQTRDAGTDMNLVSYLTGTRWLKYFKEVVWPDRFIRIFCDYMLTAENIEKIPNCVSAKLDPSYIANEDSAMNAVNKYLKSDTAYQYEGRGFLRGVNRAPDLGWGDWEFNGTVEQDNIDSFIKMKEYCDEHGIKIICVQSALIPSRLKTQNMGDVHNYFDNLFGSMGVEFYDFNYGKWEYLYRTDEDYVDADGHMMGDIADRQSKLLVEVLKSDNPEQYFYNNYDEVLAHLN